MSMAFPLFRETFEPTGVELCAAAHVVTPGAIGSCDPDVVVAKATLLDVYRVLRKDDGTARLVLAGRFHLAGRIVSMCPVRLPGHSLDALVLSFDEAKISIVQYDRTRQDLRTLSLHQFEEDALKMGFPGLGAVPDVFVDPLGKCCAMLAYDRHLVVLPFRQVTVTEDVVRTAPATDSHTGPVVSVAHTRLIVTFAAIDPALINIRRVCFLYGYNDPTIAVLCEPAPSMIGRLAMRRDTCCLFIIALDLYRENHTIIWSVDGLPTDAQHLWPVPRPIGGVCVVGSTSLVHVNQGMGLFALACNSFFTRTSALANKVARFIDRADLGIVFTNAVCTFLTNDRALVALSNGDLYILQLKNQGQQVVNVLIEKTGASVLPSSICTIGKDHVLLGSRLGDSILLHYEDQRTEAQLSKVTPKKPRLDLTMDMDELDMLLFSEDDAETTMNRAEHGLHPKITPAIRFTVCDSLVNIGPIADVTFGDAPSTVLDESDEDKNGPPNKSLELVTCSGHGKNGALYGLQSDVRPIILSTVSIPQSQDIWALSCINPDQVSETDEDASERAQRLERHRFVVISRETMTTVLKCDDSLEELPSSGFYTNGPTVYCGVFFGDAVIVQVYQDGIRLIDHKGAQVKLVPLESPDRVVSGAHAGPYLLLCYHSGRVELFQLDRDKLSLSIVNVPTNVNDTSILCASLYNESEHERCLLTVDEYERQLAAKATTITVKPDLTTTLAQIAPEVDETDLELYGETILDQLPKEKTEELKRKLHEADDIMDATTAQDSDVAQLPPLVLLVIQRRHGTLEMYSLPDCRSVFCVPHFGFFPSLLVDSPNAAETQESLKASFEEQESHETSNVSAHKVVEAQLVRFNVQGIHRTVYLMVRTETHEHAVYECFLYEGGVDAKSGDSAGRLSVRFTRVATNYLTQASYNSGSTTESAKDASASLVFRPSFRQFERIGNTSGVFLSGPRPLFFFLGKKGGLVCRPMQLDGRVKAFNAFSHVMCPRGFLYVTHQDAIKIAMLPPSLFFDVASWPLRKMPLRRTPLKISYQSDIRCYALATATPFVFKTPLPRAKDQREEIEMSEQEVALGEEEDDAGKERPPRMPTIGHPLPMTSPQVELHQLELVIPSSLDVIDSYPFRDYEHVLSLKVCSLLSDQTTSGRKYYICVGTAITTTEDNVCNGRIVIFDVVSVVPDPDKPFADKQLRRRFGKEQRAPITAIADVNGYLITCIGHTMILYQFKDGENLVGVGFINHQMYTTCMSTIRNYILAGDAMRSIWFVRFKDTLPMRVDLGGKDFNTLKVVSCEFIADGNTLSLLATDVDMNLYLFAFSPQVAESINGHKLLRQADFHVGHTVSRAVRIPAQGDDNRRTHFGLLASVDGSMGNVVPLREKSFKRLQFLQRKMNTFLPHTAGLNPRAFRMLKSSEPQTSLPKQNVLDGDLLWRYASLSLHDQRDLAQQVGSDVHQIMQDFLNYQVAVSTV